MEKPKNKAKTENYFLRFMRFIFSGIWKLLRFVAYLSSGFGRILISLLKALWNGFTGLLKQPYRLLRYLISGRVPQFETLRQEEIFWRIKRQYRRKRFFTFHVMLYIIGILGSGILSISEYLRIQDLSQLYPEYNYWNSYYEMLLGIGAGLGIWTLLLLFHFVFNRMGNEEDRALGAALEEEYARSDYQIARYERLREPKIEEEEDYQAKPKRNGVNF